jgi:hypothetical protein
MRDASSSLFLRRCCSCRCWPSSLGLGCGAFLPSPLPAAGVGGTRWAGGSRSISAMTITPLAGHPTTKNSVGGDTGHAPAARLQWHQPVPMSKTGHLLRQLKKGINHARLTPSAACRPRSSLPYSELRLQSRLSRRRSCCRCCGRPDIRSGS